MVTARRRAHVSIANQVIGRAGREQGRGIGYLNTNPSTR